MKFKSINLNAVKQTIMAIGDRGMLGAVTFLNSALLGRWGGPDEVGQFVLFFSLVFFALAVQESFTIAPYNLLAAARGDGQARRRFLGGLLIDSLGLAGIVGGAFLIGALALWAVGWTQYAVIALVLVAAAPCVLLREFARRVVYADFRPQAGFAISAGVAVLQLAMMGVLHLVGSVNAATSMAAMGASSLLGALAWLIYDRKTIDFGREARGEWYREHWGLGRWLLAGQAGEIVRYYMLPWMLKRVVSDAVVGVFSACSIVSNLPTPLHVAVSNLLVPKMADVEQRSGLRHAHRLVHRVTLWLTGVMVVYAAVVIALSAHLVPWIYGPKFTDTQHPLIVLVLACVVTGATLPAARALLIIKRADQMLWAQLAGIGVNFVLGIPMIVAWGPAGAAYAALLSSIVKGGLGCWWYEVGARRLLAEQGATSAPSPHYSTHGDHTWSAPASGVALEATP